jgi:hypothetical protein
MTSHPRRPLTKRNLSGSLFKLTHYPRPPPLSTAARAANSGGRSVNAGAALFATGFQRRSLNGSHSNRALASSALGCSFLKDGRAERHSAAQTSPRSHSSASLRSRSASALTFAARASLRYRTARALAHTQIPTAQQDEDSSTGKSFGSWPPAGVPCAVSDRPEPPKPTTRIGGL